MFGFLWFMLQDGEVAASGRVMFGAELQTVNGMCSCVCTISPAICNCINYTCHSAALSFHR